MEHDIPPVQDFSDLIYKMANQYRHKLPAGTGYELDDLVAEGYLVYCQAIQKFDPERASFMTLFHLMLWQHFNGLVRALNQNCRAGWYQDNTGCLNLLCVRDLAHIRGQYLYLPIILN